MAWLKIDSRLYSHPVALQVKPAAMGLWLLAGCCRPCNSSKGARV